MARAFYYCFWIEFNWRSKLSLWDGQCSNFLHIFLFYRSVYHKMNKCCFHIYLPREICRARTLLALSSIDRIKRRVNKYFFRFAFVCRLCVSKTPSRLQFNDCYHRFKHSTDNELDVELVRIREDLETTFSSFNFSIFCLWALLGVWGCFATEIRHIWCCAEKMLQ